MFQYNRPSAGNQNHGSGGIAIAVHKSILNNHIVVGTYKGIDGQLAVKIKNVETGFILGIVGLYLSADSFHYGQDAENYFNHCAVLRDDLGECDLLVGAGDVNARTKQLLDYIPDIDGDLVRRVVKSSFLSFLMAIWENMRLTLTRQNIYKKIDFGCRIICIFLFF